MKPRVIPAFMVNINTIPDRGLKQLVARLDTPGAALVNRAAEAMRMSQADYLRVVLVRVSEGVIFEVYGREANVSQTEN